MRRSGSSSDKNRFSCSSLRFSPCEAGRLRTPSEGGERREGNQNYEDHDEGNCGQGVRGPAPEESTKAKDQEPRDEKREESEDRLQGPTVDRPWQVNRWTLE